MLKHRAGPLARAAAVAALMTLAACGGGGGGVGGDQGTSLLPGATPLAITASNYVAVAQQAVTATTLLLDAPGLITAAQVAPGGQVLIGFARAQFSRLPGWFAAAPQLASGVVSNDTVACTGGGTITGTVSDLNGNKIVDAGDSATLVANNCVEFGVTLNGTLAFTVRTLTGSLDSNVFNASFDIRLSNLRATSPAGTVAASGNISETLISSDLNAGSADVTLSGMTIAGTFGGLSDTLTLQDWHMVSTVTPLGSLSSTSTTVSGSIVSAALQSKAVSIATQQPFVQIGGNDYPSSGQFTASGAAGSKLRVTAQDASHLRIELDADGNGAYETSITRLWSELG
jgi:hypothetical protein